jgi:hypothetical protein
MAFARDDSAYWLDDLRKIGQPIKDHTVLHRNSAEL